jgi:hypothetical protein
VGRRGLTRQADSGETIIWTARPYPGPAWRPGDLSSVLTILSITAAVLASAFAYGADPFFLILFALVSGYLLVGRFYHDAYLRRRLRYELSIEGLTIWVDGRDAPECVFRLAQLGNVRPQFVTGSGRGTIELPPGGWAAQPAWMNRWDRDVPAMYPCRRLELIDDVEAVAEILRREARRSA